MAVYNNPSKKIRGYEFIGDIRIHSKRKYFRRSLAYNLRSNFFSEEEEEDVRTYNGNLDWCTNEAQTFPVMFAPKLASLPSTVGFYFIGGEEVCGRIKLWIKVEHK